MFISCISDPYLKKEENIFTLDLNGQRISFDYNIFYKCLML